MAENLSQAPIPRAFVVRFGPYTLDLKLVELRKSGRPVRLPPQASRILALVASRPGELVTREEIQQQIWGKDTFVDFNQCLNVCIKQVRDALGDHADRPLYVETVPRRGYRFIAPVEMLEKPAASVDRPRKFQSAFRRGRPWKRAMVGFGLGAAMVVAIIVREPFWTTKSDPEHLVLFQLI